MKRNGDRSIRFNLVMLIFCTSVVLIFLLTIVNQAIFKNQARAMMQSSSRLIHDSFDWAIAPLLAAGDMDSVSRLLESIGSDRSVFVAKIVGPGGKVIASGSRDNDRLPSPELPLEDLFSKRKFMLFAWGDTAYFTATPVKGKVFSTGRNSNVAAVFVLGLEWDVYVEGYRPFFESTIMIACVAILALSALLLFFLQRRFFAPLLSFAAAASKIRDGDYAGRISEDAPKEFKSFITVFNSMAVKVGVKEAELEHRVASRTEEYRDAHAKLEQATNALVRQEKMASIGRLASGVAHEINNPIGYIQANLKAMAEYVEDFRAVIGAGDELGRALAGGSAQDIAEASRALEQTRREKDIDYLMGDAGLLLADSRKGAIRIGEIVQGLRSFAREDGGSQESCDINAILAASLRMVESKLKYNCAVERDFGALSPVKGNPGELEQVFVNLLVNAGDAIGEIGTIRVTSRSEGDSIKVTVSDDGSGMDAPTLGRIFEPFFTTKDVGKGTGLGLAISQGIIEKHRGRIEVESRVGRGTTFTVTMPFAAAERKEMAV